MLWNHLLELDPREGLARRLTHNHLWYCMQTLTAGIRRGIWKYCEIRTRSILVM